MIVHAVCDDRENNNDEEHTLRREDLAVHGAGETDSKVADVNVLLHLALALGKNLAHLKRYLPSKRLDVVEA
jgi:hypothetical protein